MNTNFVKMGQNFFAPEWFDFDRSEKMRKKKWNWMDNETGDFLMVSEQEGDDSRNPRCPKCGGKTEYIEGTYDQDFQGNDIRGWWFDCQVCNIGTPPFEGDYDGEE